MPTDDDVVELLQVAKAGIHPPDEMPFGMAWTTVAECGVRPQLHAALLAGTRRLLAGGLVPQLHGRAGRPPDRRPARRARRSSRSFARSHTGSWLGREYQGRGLGKEMRAAVLGFAFDGLDALVAETSAFLDNGPSNGVSRALGYEENGLGQPGSRGRPAGHPEVPDDRGELAFAPAATPRDRRARRDPRHVRRRVGRPS